MRATTSSPIAASASATTTATATERRASSGRWRTRRLERTSDFEAVPPPPLVDDRIRWGSGRDELASQAARVRVDGARAHGGRHAPHLAQEIGLRAHRPRIARELEQ